MTAEIARLVSTHNRVVDPDRAIRESQESCEYELSEWDRKKLDGIFDRIDKASVAGYRYISVEGYLFYNEDVLRRLGFVINVNSNTTQYDSDNSTTISW